MAAAAAEIRNFLSNVIGMVDAAGCDVNARRQAVMDEGLSTMQDLSEFNEEDVKTLCSLVRKPGGTIVNPNNPVERISNPGHSIPAIAEKRLKLACYGAAIYWTLDRPIDANSLNQNRLRDFEKHQETVEEHQDPESLP